MRPDLITKYPGETLDLTLFSFGDAPVFVDLDAATAGALTGDAEPGQEGFLRFGDAEIGLRDVENIIGGDAPERLFGGEEDGFILAGGGDDTVHPFNGDDYVDGGDGVDTLLLNAINGPLKVDLKRGFAKTEDQHNEIVSFENVTGSNLFSDRISGDGRDNILSGGAGGDDTLRGRGGDDELSGGEGADKLNGGRGDDMLLGGNGDDRLRAGAGDDTVTGGEGADLFVFLNKNGENTVTDLSFDSGDALAIIGRRPVENDDELLALADDLNNDGFARTSATLDGEDLTLDFGRMTIILEDVATGWSGELIAG